MRTALHIVILVLIAAILFYWPSLDCVPPYAAWRSPDLGVALTICRRPLPFAIPGQASDAPGYAVLRRGGRIAGVVGLEMVGAVDQAPEWTNERVVLPLQAEFELPATRPSLGTDLLWQLRTVLGAIPHSTDFH